MTQLIAGLGAPGAVAPTAWLLVAVAVYGLAAGWVASWIAHRFVEGDDEMASFADADCSECGRPLTLADTAPWKVLVGRAACPDCGTAPGWSWVATQIAVPLVCLAMVATWGASWLVVPFLWLVPVLAVAAVTDIRTMLIPRHVVWVGFAVGAALIVAVSLHLDVTRQLRPALLGAVGYFGFLFIVNLVAPAGMGYGDVRLSLLLGLYLGWINLLLPAIGLFIACCVGVALGLVARARSGGGRAAFPFGPGLAVGAIIAICFYQPLLDAVIAT